MELRQLRYFVRIVELGGFGRAALDLDLVQSALSQQITRLESELSTRLLVRTSKGVTPTEAGLAFFREAQLTLRHAAQAARVAQESRLSGTVSIGLAPTTASVLGTPLMLAMRERYPNVRLHMVESLSGHLADMLNSRLLDLAVLYGTDSARRWSVAPLLEERLFLIQSARRPVLTPLPATLRVTELKGVPLILPTGTHGLRNALDSAFARAKLKPNIALEIDSLALLMDGVEAGLGATVQPLAATRRYHDAEESFQYAEVLGNESVRVSSLCSLSNDELSPAALAARAVLSACARDLVQDGRWPGARLSDHDS